MADKKCAADNARQQHLSCLTVTYAAESPQLQFQTVRLVLSHLVCPTHMCRVRVPLSVLKIIFTWLVYIKRNYLVLAITGVPAL